MVDCVGKELKVGDKVICSDMNYADLLIGEIIGFTPKKIRVKYHRSIDGFDFRKDQLKHPYQVFKYEEVVRCKDCRWARKKDHREPTDTQRELICQCFKHHYIPAPWGARMAVSEDDFCSYGERRDNAR